LRVATHDGLAVYAEAHGDGIPLVLSCALATTHENWRPQVEPLVAAGARVVLWDFIGHGRSDAPADPDAYHLDRVVDDLARVLDWAAPGEPAVVGGLSFGGLLSLHFALRARDRVRALLLVDTGPGFKKPEAQATWEARTERIAAKVEEIGMAAYVAGRAAPQLVGQRTDTPAGRAAAVAIAAQTPHGIANFARRVAGPASPVIDRLGEIDVPALVVVGEKDDAYLRAAEVLEARLPRAERRTIAGAGHIVNLDDPDAFVAEVTAFLARLAP
jgi:pimeloyl-ACP methyl ester carboxylesterase